MVLDGIVQRQRAALAARPPDVADLRRRLGALGPPRDFAAALLAAERPALIAEFKRRSPSRGVINATRTPAEAALAYQAGGAAAMSVLTSAEFDGSLTDLSEARAASSFPLLRKDFILEEVQLLEARVAGADCVLLVARVLTAAVLADLTRVAHDLGLQVLLEVHGEGEVEAALAAAPDLIGVNHRDLQTFEVDPHLFARVAPMLPPGLPMVAESGMATRADVLAAASAGAHAVLVGETLMRAPDPAAMARILLGAGV